MWEPLAGPPGDPVRELDIEPDGTVIATSLSGRFASRDRGTTWSTATTARGGPGVPPLGLEQVTPLAHARRGGLVWRASRTTSLGSYDAPGPGGMPITHHATVITEVVEGSRDGGATWHRADRRGVADLLVDRSDRIWVASSDGLDVADGRQIGAAPLSWRRALSRATTCVAVDDHDRIVVGTRDAAWLSSDGQTFAAIPPRAVERGDWGSLEIEARGFVRMRVAPGGAVWAIAGSGPCHVVRLADERPRWIPVCAGLTFIPGVGSRRAQVTTTAIHFTPDGTAFAVTASQGLFRRAPEAGASV